MVKALKGNYTSDSVAELTEKSEIIFIAVEPIPLTTAQTLI